MRLIDADTYSFKEMIGGIRYKDISIGYAEGFNSALKAIERAATVEARPIVHAKLISRPSIKKFKYTNIITSACSNCGFHFCDILNNHIDFYKYCPNCGATIDVEDSNED